MKKRFMLPLAVLILATTGSFAASKLWQSSDKQPFEARFLQRESTFDGLLDDVPIRNKSDTLKDLIVLPEYSDVYAQRRKIFSQRNITSQLSSIGVVLDVSADFENAGPRYSYLLTRDKQNIIDSQTKRLLIPTGEYLPNILKGFYALTGQTNIIDNFTRTRKLEKGDFPHIVKTENFKIAPVACSGILGRNIYRTLVNEGGNVLTNSAALTTFGGSQSYFRQSVEMARFHAMANNRTFIQATMGAPGFVIDGNGRYVVEPDRTTTELTDFQFTANNDKTIYTKYGDWPLVLSGVIVFAYALFGLLNKIKNRRNI